MIIFNKINTKGFALAAATLLLIGQFCFQLYLARADSQTTDEAVHLSAGYTYLTRHEFRYNPEHPPLVKMLAALPLLVIQPHMPDDTVSWEKAGNFFYDSWQENRELGGELLYNLGNNADQLLFWGRVPIIVLTLLLGLAIFLISAQLWGWAGGLVSLLIYVFNPTVTAHGHLITTDIAISLGYLLSVWSFWQLLKEQTKHNAIIFGLAFGFASLVKFTSVILLPIFLIISIWFSVKNNWKFDKFVNLIGHGFIALLMAWFMIWACYGFSTVPAPASTNIVDSIKNSNTINMQAAQDLAKANKVANSIYSVARYVLVPKDYFKGLSMVFTHVSGGHDSYLLGKTSHSGWWYYFPAVMFFKTSLAELALLALTCFVIFKKEKDSNLRIIAIAAFLYLLFSMTSKANLGVRHILPWYPLLYVTAGVLATWSLKNRKTLLVSTLLVVQTLTWLIIQPNDLSYFNLLAGSSYNGWQIAGDSNLDWGQDIKRLKDYLVANNIQSPYIDYGWDGDVALNYYGINRQPISALSPSSKGVVILSANSIHEPQYTWLKNLKPSDRPTPGTFLYRLE